MCMNTNVFVLHFLLFVNINVLVLYSLCVCVRARYILSRIFPFLSLSQPSVYVFLVSMMSCVALSLVFFFCACVRFLSVWVMCRCPTFSVCTLHLYFLSTGVEVPPNPQSASHPAILLPSSSQPAPYRSKQSSDSHLQNFAYHYAILLLLFIFLFYVLIRLLRKITKLIFLNIHIFISMLNVGTFLKSKH